MSEGINPNIKRKKRRLRSAIQYIADLSVGDRYALSEVLTIIENERSEMLGLKQDILRSITRLESSNSIRIGITGSPGAGKSTLIEQIGLQYVNRNIKTAVLAVDPTSTKTDGSILGDKTRMPLLSNHENAYVRPTPSATHLGGVSRTTSESISVCEKAGFEIIIIESVGVGQSEVELADIVDVVVVVLQPGGGDDIQGIKRGIIEMGDIFVINKSDGDRKTLAKHSKKDYEGSIQLFTHPFEKWKPPVLLASALHGSGMEELTEQINDFIEKGKATNYFDIRRNYQEQAYIKAQIQRYIESMVQLEFSKFQDSANLKDSKDRLDSPYSKAFAIIDELKKNFNR